MHADFRPRRAKAGDPRCEAFNARGSQCGNCADVELESQYCLLHDPERLTERSAYQRSLSEKAVAARRAPTLRDLANDIPPTRLDSLNRVRKMLERVAAEVEQSGEPATAKANSLCRVAAEVRGILEASDIERRLEDLERRERDRDEHGGVH